MNRLKGVLGSALYSVCVCVVCAYVCVYRFQVLLLLFQMCVCVLPRCSVVVVAVVG